MKRIFWFLAISALVLGACNKEKKDKDEVDDNVISEENLLGAWACTYWNSNGQELENPPYCLIIAPDHSAILQFSSDENHRWDWTLEEDNLKLSGEPLNPATTIKRLNGKYLEIEQFLNGDNFYGKFISVSRILPGKWKINYPDAYTIATIDANGTLVEEYQTDPPSDLECEWNLIPSNGNVVMHISEIIKGYVRWETNFICTTVSEKRIEAKQSLTNADIVLERQ